MRVSWTSRKALVVRSRRDSHSIYDHERVVIPGQDSDHVQQSIVDLLISLIKGLENGRHVIWDEECVRARGSRATQATER